MAEQKYRFDVLVIGGGAAGLTAAVAAAENGAKTAILEHKDRVGKKILSTGNGKCNYTNELQGITYYRGEDPAFVLPVMKQFGFSETVSFFKKLGIFPKNKNGYYYPASEQAASVVDVFRMELDYQKVTVFTECGIQKFTGQKHGFLVHTNCGIITAQAVIFATGLLAAPKTGSDGSAIPFIKALGHRFSEIVPALVALQCKETFFKQLAGVRVGGNVTLFIDGRKAASEDGELQLADYGISGIPVFQVSRYASKALKQKKEVQAQLDFCPNLTDAALKEEFSRRFFKNAHKKTAGGAMTGFLNKKLAEVLLKLSEIDLSAPASAVSEKQLSGLIENCKRLTVHVTGTKSFEQAQVCAGGILTRDIDNRTMESKLVPNVYFAGEVVDIDGTCGGYNLQWAWSSGYVAGAHAARRVKNQE